MGKEYRLTIQAAGDSEEEAIESAIRMLNLGASFDEVAHLSDLPEPSPRDSPRHWLFQF
jgi:hypothetical protein